MREGESIVARGIVGTCGEDEEEEEEEEEKGVEKDEEEKVEPGS